MPPNTRQSWRLFLGVCMCEEGVYKKVDKTKAWERKVEGQPTERPLAGYEFFQELGGRDQGQGGTEVELGATFLGEKWGLPRWCVP